MKSLVVTAALVATIASTAPAVAQERSVRVSYADLDLSASADRAKLQQRVARVLERVCGSYAAVAHGDADRIGGCRRTAAADAGRQVERLALRQAEQRLAGR